jgi:anti-sigma regulatory factor (Ser/Thr protein kinase)
MSTEPELALRLDIDPRSPLVARREIQSFAAGLDEEVRCNLALLVSELVTNSLKHAALGHEAWIQVNATIGPEAVRVEVMDPGRSFPPAPDLEGQGGWGLLLVDRVASRWGVDRGARTETRVWFEADLPGRAPAWAHVVGAWPETIRRTARTIVGVLGTPQVVTDRALVWDHGGCRFVVERTSDQTGA